MSDLLGSKCLFGNVSVRGSGIGRFGLPFPVILRPSCGCRVTGG